MKFLKRYPVSLQELLLTPLLMRASHPALAGVPEVSGALLQDLAGAFGHQPGAVRTALSRLRSAGAIEGPSDALVPGAVGRSVSSVVLQRPQRPEGYVLAIFSFTTEATRERHLVREALKLHGFQKLAQNVYINGQVDTAGLEQVLAEQGLSGNCWLFRGSEEQDPALDRRLVEVFGVKERAEVLTRFEKELRAFLEEAGPGPDFARRFIAATPVHHRVTFTEEPPIPRRCLPADYPLERLLGWPLLSGARAKALKGYFSQQG